AGCARRLTYRPSVRPHARGPTTAAGPASKGRAGTRRRAAPDARRGRRDVRPSALAGRLRAQLRDQVHLARDRERVRMRHVELRDRSLLLEVLQVRPDQRDQRGDRPGDEQAFRGAEEDSAGPLDRAGEPALHPLVQEVPEQLGDDLRREKDGQRHRRGRDRHRQPDVLGEGVAERLGEEPRQHDPSDEPRDAEDLPEQAAIRSPQREEHDQRQQREVEHHRTVMSVLTSFAASSRLDLKFGLYGSYVSAILKLRSAEANRSAAMSERPAMKNLRPCGVWPTSCSFSFFISCSLASTKRSFFCRSAPRMSARYFIRLVSSRRQTYASLMRL